MPLTDAQKAIKAQTKIENLELKEDLANLKAKIDELFRDAPIAVAETLAKEELEVLIVEIKKGTASNDKISRFLIIASQLGI